MIRLFENDFFERQRETQGVQSSLSTSFVPLNFPLWPVRAWGPRRQWRTLFGIACLSLCIGVLAPRASAQRSEHAKALGEKITCMCGGCNDAAGLCKHSGGAFAGPCETAKKELDELDARVTRGESDDLTLQAFVQEYGPTVILVPPTKGFDLWAWIMPVLLPIIALALIAFMVQRWRKRAAVAAPVHVPADLLARARRESHLDE